MQRTVGTQVHRNLGATQQIEHRQAIVRRLLDAHVAKARGDADELHLGARDGIGQRHRIVNTHIQIKDQLLGCHCSTPLLRLYRLTKPMFNFGARGNRLLSAQARHRHCRGASARGHALKERQTL